MRFLDTTRFLLIGPKGEASLTNKEYQTFLILMQKPDTLISVDTIMEKVWGPDSTGQENALWTVVYNLRKKLESIGSNAIIQNKRNLGYIMEIQR